MADVHPVSAKTMQGASLMLLRMAASYPILFLGEVWLARLLNPQDFGIFAMAGFVTVTLAAVLEVGLTAALIQRPSPPTREEFQTFFSLQLLLISVLVAGLFLLAPRLLGWLGLDASVRWILPVLLLCPWISGLGAMSCVHLDRSLRYGVLARMDVLRVLTYVGVALPLAFWGWGVWSLVIAMVASTAARSAVAYRAAPWPIGIRLGFAGMGKTLRSGVLFQASTLTSLFRDHIPVLLAGPRFGPQAVGYLNWARNMTFYSSQAMTQAVSRVTFPSVSRIQQDPEAVRRMAQATFKYVNLVTFPGILIFAALIPEFVQVVFTSKWAPAIPAFYWYAVRMLGSNISTLHIAVLNGLGKIEVSLRILAWWTVLDWALALALCPRFGFTGVAMAYAVGVIPIAAWLVLQLNQRVKVDFFRSFVLPLAISGAAATAVWLTKGISQPSWLTLSGWVVGGLGLHVLLVLAIEGQSLLGDVRVFLAALARKGDRGLSETSEKEQSTKGRQELSTKENDEPRMDTNEHQ